MTNKMLKELDPNEKDLISELDWYKHEYFAECDRAEKLEKALDKGCNELMKMCIQTKCKDCHFTKETLDSYDGHNWIDDCPVQGNYCSYDWKEWCLKDE